MVSGMIGGSPADEDDAIAVVALTKAVEVAAGGGAGVGGCWGWRCRWNGGGHVRHSKWKKMVFYFIVGSHF
jgi:hypothetical protein